MEIKLSGSDVNRTKLINENAGREVWEIKFTNETRREWENIALFKKSVRHELKLIEFTQKRWIVNFKKLLKEIFDA
jgi:hypothetical protein